MDLKEKVRGEPSTSICFEGVNKQKEKRGSIEREKSQDK